MEQAHTEQSTYKALPVRQCYHLEIHDGRNETSLSAARDITPRHSKKLLKEQTEFKKTEPDSASSKLSYHTTFGPSRSNSPELKDSQTYVAGEACVAEKSAGSVQRPAGRLQLRLGEAPQRRHGHRCSPLLSPLLPRRLNLFASPLGCGRLTGPCA